MSSLSRKSRNYKERRRILTFGHFALPLAALVALGLLFVGIKLFFLTPSQRTSTETASYDVATTKTVSLEEEIVPVEAEEKQTPPPPATPSVKPETKQKVQLAGPVDHQAKTSSKPQAAAENRSVAKRNTAASTTKKRTETAVSSKGSTSAPEKGTKKPVAQSQGSSSWAVQIGAFVNQEGAVRLVEQARKDGYSATVARGELSGKEYHRVRVAAGSTRESAEKLAAELEKKGYPVSLVPIR